MMVESLLEILTERRRQMFYKPIDVYCVINVVGKIISSISMYNIGNQLQCWTKYLEENREIQ